MEPRERRDDQRLVVAGRAQLGGGGRRGRAHLVGLTGSRLGSSRQFVPQVPGNGLLRLPLAADQRARLDLDSGRSTEGIGRSRRGYSSRVVEHDPGSITVAARDGLTEHGCADGPADRPAARDEPRSKRMSGVSRAPPGNRRTELAPECARAQPSGERPGAGHERSLEAGACTLAV
jgi:hypothetical protein